MSAINNNDASLLEDAARAANLTGAGAEFIARKSGNMYYIIVRRAWRRDATWSFRSLAAALDFLAAGMTENEQEDAVQEYISSIRTAWDRPRA